MTRGCVFRNVCLLLLLVPLAVTSTPPTPSPPNFYRVRGQVRDGAGAPRENVLVALAADCHPGGFVLLTAGRNDCGYVDPDRGIPAAVTDSEGRFYLDVVTSAGLDTMAVAIVYPDTFLTGRPLDRGSMHTYAVTEPFPHEDEGFFCSDSIDYETRVVGQAYEFAPDTLVLDTN